MFHATDSFFCPQETFRDTLDVIIKFIHIFRPDNSPLFSFCREEGEYFSLLGCLSGLGSLQFMVLFLVLDDMVLCFAVLNGLFSLRRRLFSTHKETLNPSGFLKKKKIQNHTICRHKVFFGR